MSGPSKADWAPSLSVLPWLSSQKAIKDLCGIVDVYFPAKSLMTATGERLLKKR
ncbi:MAG TPA: hypothetical protein VNG33_06075 [Polyangiaceae bacterium]|nr:hypothetical protein [Polyangiaceae bacterium]